MVGIVFGGMYFSVVSMEKDVLSSEKFLSEEKYENFYGSRF